MILSGSLLLLLFESNTAWNEKEKKNKN